MDRQTDGRQTDRQTDRILIARPRLHCMQRGKNEFVLCYLGMLHRCFALGHNINSLMAMRQS